MKSKGEMSEIVSKITEIKEELGANVTLVAVSKTKPNSMIEEAYEGGQRVFGENKVQELVDKYEALPKDIIWHMIGHLQSNKVKYIAPFVSLIHGVDSSKLLKEINKQGAKNNRVINCLLQLKVAKEESKFGMDFEEAEALLKQRNEYPNVALRGVMGMATFTDDSTEISSEFARLSMYFEKLKTLDSTLEIVSMGMSGDYKIAVKEGSNMVRIGSTIFGARNYPV